MKRKLLLLSISILGLLLQSIGQRPQMLFQKPEKQNKIHDPLLDNTNISTACTELKNAPYVSMDPVPKKDNLISNYSFRKLIKKNFGNLILGNDNISKIGRYATLDITDDNAFSFSPYTFESNPEKSNYQNIFSINFSGQLNDKKIFKLADYRDLSASISFVRILNWTNYTTIERPNASFKEKYRECILKAPLEKLCKKYAELVDKGSACLSEVERQQKLKPLYKEFVNEYADLETELAEEFWSKKKFWWINIDFKFYGRDKFQYLTKASLDAKNYSPTETTVYTPGLTIGLNHFIKNNLNDNSFLLSVWGELNRKHSLSDIFEPDDFQPYHSINDSLIQLKSLESVYITDFEEPITNWKVDFGIRLVKMIDISSLSRKRQIGFSILFNRKGLVNDDSFPSLFRTEAGLVIPFLKADGESSFNLEIFRRWDNFSNFPSENEHFWGLRFNVPINSK